MDGTVRSEQTIPHQTRPLASPHGPRSAAGNSCRTGPPLGAHMSIAGGLERAFDAARAAGCDCLQIFVKNQRQWRGPGLSPQQVDAFRAAQRETGIAPVVAHASYLINLASPEPKMRRRSVRAMIDELTRCEALGIPALIVHPGSYLDGTVQSGVRRIVRSLNEMHTACAGFRTLVLLETTAGQGTAIGRRFDQIAAILRGVRDADGVGACLDTCHLFAAGYDFRTEERYAAMTAELDSAIGVSRVRCIHVNDSKRPCGSRVDRHEHIGKGKIGKRGFAHFISDARWRDVPFILETPKGTDGRGTSLDKVNLERLRAMF